MKKIILLLSAFSPLLLPAQQFTRVTTGPLVNTAGDSRSVNWIDFNNDGLIDCQITNGPTGGQNNMLYLNAGGGNFTAVTGDTIVNDMKPSDGATWGDYDNDGDIDAFVVNWYNADNLLYLNNGNASFTFVDSEIPSSDGGYSETASWGDYDNDGYIDLYVTNSAGNRKNFLYHNNGNATFTKITTGDLVNDAFYSRSVNWTDMDDDGDLDLFVSNETNQHENIYRNDAGLSFTRLSGGPLLLDGGSTMSSSWADYDNDGDLDVFLANDGGTNSFFRNDGNFTFYKITGDTLVNTASHSFSSAWSDIDNDGDLDLYVTNAFTASLRKNFLYINNGNGSFTRNGTDAAVLDSMWSYGCAFGDYDNDGFEDLAVATVRYNTMDYPDLLYHNNGNSNHWITISLTGTTANRSAIGTKVRLRAVINGNPVWQLREVSAQPGYCSQNDMRVHFGLGDATVIDSLVFEWMDSTEVMTNVNVNQFISVTQSPVLNSVHNQKGTQHIKVYPNPSSGIVYVENGKAGFEAGQRFSVIDTNGKKIVEQNISSNQNRIELNLEKKYSPGVYYLIIEMKDKRVLRKLVLK